MTAPTPPSPMDEAREQARPGARPLYARQWKAELPKPAPQRDAADDLFEKAKRDYFGKEHGNYADLAAFLRARLGACVEALEKAEQWPCERPRLAGMDNRTELCGVCRSCLARKALAVARGETTT